MLALAISLLIGFGTAISIQVIYSSVATALRAYGRLTGEIELLEAAGRRRVSPARPRGSGQRPRYAAA